MNTTATFHYLKQLVCEDVKNMFDQIFGLIVDTVQDVP